MDDVGLVQAVLDLTSLGLLNRLGDVHRNGAGLGVRHEALGAQDLTEAADNAHHVRGSDDDVIVEEVLVLDLRDHVLCADILCASSRGLVSLGALGEYQHADLLAGAVRQDDRAADLLVCVTGVNAQLDVQLDGLVELCLCGRNNGCKRLSGIVQLGTIYQLCALYILFTFAHNNILL